ncbi:MULTISPECIES: group II truncated hemoglobin [unclassified Shewanella]|uniref:group II truncated hemoglobin n=1 Tax=unclassified Shewanella TaxID=196818 RepID=UPI000C8148FB|nr:MULTISPECIES: group II truncated hemoglobin [unclassified Shewanella]MDO6619116.1 group II truncated hemoglobin [Shewanella sp. 6_MG-2023]MDO6642113.1 group II truncated hemoglobin [Shewanella sp. 5_MG-2023]MDO6680618.1 group II truncated hemoglobin [Shewanella sp. 4_MG-2023]MDO6777592.1 group II truncated hemoglobin [Shewanella sp. 3_MG-2023]PMG30900.1 globin [Shewanella sp. 10N.286.52.C2]
MNWLKKLFSNKAQPDDRDPNQSNAYDLIGGEKTIRLIAQNFYQQMQSREDTQPLLAIHRAPIKDSQQKLFEFLSGWLGGPQLYQQKYGHPALRARHMPFDIDQTMVDQWLTCMEQAIAEAIKKPEHQQVIFQAISQLANNMRNKD